jgi:hypothetical protein
MSTLPVDERLERRARRRVGLKLGWYTHALIYALVNAGLIALDAANGGYRWSVFPLAGWGLGLAIHGLVVFVALRDGWRERLIAAEVEALMRRGR